MIELGESFTEAEAEMYVVSRYVIAKKEWIKWKKMIAKVAVSDMKWDTLLELTVYKIFEEGGLFDQVMAYQKDELLRVRSKMQTTQLFDMNL
jgi:hypothetical protein